MTETMSMKKLAKKVFVEGYKLGKSKEDLREIEVKTAERNFEQWWERNYDG